MLNISPELTNLGMSVVDALGNMSTVPLDPIVNALYQKLNEKITKYNTLIEKLNAAQDETERLYSIVVQQYNDQTMVRHCETYPNNLNGGCICVTEGGPLWWGPGFLYPNNPPLPTDSKFSSNLYNCKKVQDAAGCYPGKEAGPCATRDVGYANRQECTRKGGCWEAAGPWEAVYNASTFKTKSDAFKQAFDALSPPSDSEQQRLRREGEEARAQGGGGGR